jgi:alkylhydroperoxidase/carboxymuconolactone decarboxylase family protein YurZ
MKKEWHNEKESFEVIDVRKMTGNFLPMILKKAQEGDVGSGICIVQSFEPIPLYSALDDLGFKHLTEKVSADEYRVYFYRSEIKEPSTPTGMDAPLKPTAIVNFKGIDNELANIVVNFWSLIWEHEKPAIDQKTKLLLSLANGVGAGRYRQATRELVKAYAVGVTVAELDELFSMFVWNQGVGTFASEIGPSPLFAAYQLIKKLEGSGKPRDEVMKELVGKFGENNPAVGTFYREEVPCRCSKATSNTSTS